MIIGIADTPDGSELRLGRAAAHERRRQAVAKMIASMLVEIIDPYDECDTITIAVGSAEFVDRRDEYPSEKLVANLALALDAQRVNPDAFQIADFEDEDLPRFEPKDYLSRSTEQRFRKEELDMVATSNVRGMGRTDPDGASLLVKGVRW